MTPDIGPENMTLKRTLGIHCDITHTVLLMLVTRIKRNKLYHGVQKREIYSLVCLVFMVLHVLLYMRYLDV